MTSIETNQQQTDQGQAGIKIDKVFISIDAADFTAQSDWWAKLFGRHHDREPMPTCHEWDLTDHVLFQVLDNVQSHGRATVSMHVDDLDAEITRLAKIGIDVPEPVKIEGFDTLRYAEFYDPEGNKIGLLDGA